jgi:hypothetical protein
MTGKGEPKTAYELLSTINELRATRIEVHESIFCFRNLFRTIDFERYHVVLEIVTNAIEELEVLLHLKSKYWRSEIGEQDFELVVSYIARLKQASSKLRNIVGNLEFKNKGNPYPALQYKTEIGDYHRSEDAYKALGNNMSSLFRRISQQNALPQQIWTAPHK